MLKGVDILIGTARAVGVSFVESNDSWSKFRVQITEGRKHVVRFPKYHINNEFEGKCANL